MFLTLICIKQSLILFSVVTGWVSISPFASLSGNSIGFDWFCKFCSSTKNMCNNYRN